jgi:pimeloyl-ACP methyl ester carboxylesterase
MWRDAEFDAYEPTLAYVQSVEDGAGPAIVFFHGVLRAWNSCLPLAAHLSVRYDLWALDHRGHGGSAPAERYLVVDYVADACRWLSEVVKQPVVLYGHSLGAMVAAAVAAQCPHLARGIVLEDPPFETMGSRIAASGFQSYFAQIAQLLADRDSTAILAKRLADVKCVNGLTGISYRLGDVRDAASLRFFASTLMRVDPRVLAPVVAGNWLQGYDLPRTFSDLRCPALVLQADQAVGGMLSEEDASRLSELAGDVSRVRFAGVGHNIAWQRTQEVVNLVFSFMESLEPTPAGAGLPGEPRR